MKLSTNLVIPPLLMLLTGCSGWQSALNAQGAPAQRLEELIFWIVTTCAFVWMIVIVLLAKALWRRREPARDPLYVDAQREHRMMLAVLLGIGATVLIITSFTVESFFTTRALTMASPADLTVVVHGKQWWWDIEYPGSGTPPLKIANEIHIPVGRNVRVELEGDDVIHSFWVPSLAGKQDLIPGRKNVLNIRAEREGVYRGQCAEFCGMQHAHMAFLVIADEAGEFQKWSQSQAAPSVAATNPEIETGREVFLSKPCAACHTVRGTSAKGGTGPDLTHVGSRRFIAAGMLPTTVGSLAAWIADPQTIKPGNNMPMVPLAPEELRAVAAYMYSLK